MLARSSMFVLLLAGALPAHSFAQEASTKQMLLKKSEVQGKETAKAKKFEQTFDWYVMTNGSRDGYSVSSTDSYRTRYAVNGAAVFPLGERWAVEGDAELDEAAYNSGSDIPNGMSGNIGGNVFWRDPERGLIGLNTEIARIYFTDGFETMRYSAGPEFGYYLDRHSFLARASYHYWANTYDHGGTDINYSGRGIEFNGSWNYFITDNFSTGLNAGYKKLINGNPYIEFTYESYLAGVMSEYKFDSSPFSLFLQGVYEKGSFAFPAGSLDVNGYRVLLGLKYNFGDKSLFQHDRSGASMRGRPDFHFLDDLYAVTLPAG